LVYGLLKDMMGSAPDVERRQARALLEKWEEAKGLEPDIVKAPTIDYSADQLTALIKEHGAIADKVRVWMQDRDRGWPPCTAEKPRSSLPVLPSGQTEPDKKVNTGLPISDTVATHVDYVMAQTEDVKASQANKVLRLWPEHFGRYCSYRPTMEEREVRAFMGTSPKDLDKLVAKTPARKRSIEASRALATMGQNTLKCGALVDSMTHVVDEAAGEAKHQLDVALQSLKHDVEVDPADIESRIRKARDACQMVSVVNASMAFAGFTAVDLGARAVHTAIRALRVDHLKTLLDTEKVSNLDRLTKELPVESRSLFGGHLSAKIVDCARDATSFATFSTMLTDMGLRKPRSVASRLTGTQPFRARRLQGASSSKSKSSSGTRSRATWKKPQTSDSRRRGGGSASGAARDDKPSGRGTSRGGRGGADRASRNTYKGKTQKKGKK